MFEFLFVDELGAPLPTLFVACSPVTVSIEQTIVNPNHLYQHKCRQILIDLFPFQACEYVKQLFHTMEYTTNTKYEIPNIYRLVEYFIFMFCAFACLLSNVFIWFRPCPDNVDMFSFHV